MTDPAAAVPPLAVRREQQRHRSQTKHHGNDTIKTGHPVLFGDPTPAVELGRMPDGGGYPVGLIQFAGKVMGVTDHRHVIHLCSGSVRAPLTFDIRPDSDARCIADVRYLPIRDSCARWVMVDPPYSAEHAERLWARGNEYPTPIGIMREVERILAPGGSVAFLHFIVPRLAPGLQRIGTYGVTIGPGYRIRALTIARKVPAEAALIPPSTPIGA